MKLDTIEILVYLTGNLFRIYIISHMFCILFKKAISKTKYMARIILYILYYVINSAAFMYFACPPKLILLTNIIGTLAVSMTYTGTWKYRIYAVVSSLALHTICEDLCYYFLVFYGIKHILIVGIISAEILFFLIVLVLEKYIDFKNQVEVSFLEWVAIVVIPIFSLFISTVVLDRCNDEIAMAIGEISLIAEMLLLFLLLNHIQAMYQEKLDVNLLRQQNQAYENQILLLNESREKISSFRHDVKNYLAVLEQLALQDECDEIQKYLKGLISEVESAKTYASTGNYIIDGFLNMKIEKINSLGASITLKLDISDDMMMQPKDISIILGNLLDNSISAIEKCKGQKMFNLIMKETPGTLYIKIENSHEEIIRKHGNVFLTSKHREEGHGIGLKNVQKVVNSYHGQMNIEYTECCFSVSMVLFI